MLEYSPKEQRIIENISFEISKKTETYKLFRGLQSRLEDISRSPEVSGDKSEKLSELRFLVTKISLNTYVDRAMLIQEYEKVSPSVLLRE